MRYITLLLLVWLSLLTVCGCRVRPSGKPIAQALIKIRFSSAEIETYVMSPRFTRELQERMLSIPIAASDVHAGQFRDTTLIALTATSTSETNALHVVSAMITLINEHFCSPVVEKATNDLISIIVKSEGMSNTSSLLTENLATEIVRDQITVQVVEKPRIIWSQGVTLETGAH